MMRDLLFAIGLLSIFCAGIVEVLSYSSVSTSLWFIGIVCVGVSGLITLIKENVV